jgi:hypothetical protein
MKFWIDIFLDMKWKLIWWFYMTFAATLFFNNTFGSSSIGLWWLSKSIIYMFCFMFASIRLWKCRKKKPVSNRPTTRPISRRPERRPLRNTHSDYAVSGSITIPSTKPVRDRGHVYSIRGGSYIDDVDVWCTDLDKNIKRIIKRTEQNVQKIKDRARRIETRNKIKRDEWDTKIFDID